MNHERRAREGKAYGDDKMIFLCSRGGGLYFRISVFQDFSIFLNGGIFMSAVLQKDRDVWQLQQAKAQFSEVVNFALEGVPQLVTRSGRPSVYIISAKIYEAERARKGLNRKDILVSSPCCDVALDMPQSKNDGREVVL